MSMDQSLQSRIIFLYSCLLRQVKSNFYLSSFYNPRAIYKWHDSFKKKNFNHFFNSRDFKILLDCCCKHENSLPFIISSRKYSFFQEKKMLQINWKCRSTFTYFEHKIMLWQCCLQLFIYNVLYLHKKYQCC